MSPLCYLIEIKNQRQSITVRGNYSQESNRGPTIYIGGILIGVNDVIII